VPCCMWCARGGVFLGVMVVQCAGAGAVRDALRAYGAFGSHAACECAMWRAWLVGVRCLG
jgi:hypothetical protein